MASPHHRPQRLAPPASPGALLKRLYALEVRRKAKEATEREPTYLAMIRQLPCLRCGQEPAGEAAHVRLQSAAHGKRGGAAKKPADKWALPLCAGCHWRDPDSQHRVGEALFWAGVGINPLWACEKLYAARGTEVGLRAAALAIIATR